MRYEDSPVKAPPPTTLLKKSYESLDGEHGRNEVEDQTWRAREKAPWRQNWSSASNERQWQVWDGKSNGLSGAPLKEELDEKGPEYFQARRRTISWQAEGVGWNAKKKR